MSDDKSKEWETSFYTSYNTAFRCYLNNISPIIFVHDFIEKVVKTTKSSVGYVASLHSVDNKYVINMEAIYKDELHDDTTLHHNLYVDINTESICLKTVISEKICIINDIKIINIDGEPLRPPEYCRSCVCIPYKFNNKITGVIGLYSKNEYLDDCLSSFELLGNLMANLQNSYFKMKLSGDNNDKKVLAYQLMDDVLNTVHDGILIIENNFDIIKSNSYASQLFDELYEKKYDNLMDMFPGLTKLNKSKENKIFKNRKIDIYIDDIGIKKVLEFVFNTVICNGNFYHLVTIHNIEKKDVMRGMNSKCLIAYLSHELRNPLQSITLANHLVRSTMKFESVVSSKVPSYLEIINRSCHDMKKIIDDILDLSRIEYGEFIIDLEMCQIDDIINGAIEENLCAASIKGLTLEKYVDDDIPKTIYTDITRSSQILNNLITNAIKYSNTGPIMLKVSCDYANAEIIFSIVDKGIGIKSDELSDLFKPYGQTSSSVGNLNSHGLGLCVSQKIANLLGGKITVKSEHMKGSTFSFFHPIKLGTSNKQYDNNIIKCDLRGNILIVDDNSSNLMLLHMLLEQFNYEHQWEIKIELASNGHDAINLCKINNYDLIFMDINMIGIDGCTTSKIIKNNKYNGKIVATTGNILTKKENEGFGYNNYCKYFDDVIIKPFDDNIVLKILKTYLAKYE